MKSHGKQKRSAPSSGKESQSFSLKARIGSFRYAFRGLRLLIAKEHNAWIHSLATVGVIVLGVYFDITEFEWCALIFAMGLVWAAEALNTAIEYLADAVSPERNERVGQAKDLAAAGVLLAAIAALFIGLLVLGPYVTDWLAG